MKSCFLCGYRINLLDGTKAEIRKKTRRVHISCLETRERGKKHLENLFAEETDEEIFLKQEVLNCNCGAYRIAGDGNILRNADCIC